METIRSERRQLVIGLWPAIRWVAITIWIAAFGPCHSVSNAQVSPGYQVTVVHATTERVEGSAFDPAQPEGSKLVVELFRSPIEANPFPLDAATADMEGPDNGQRAATVGFRFTVAGKGLKAGDNVLIRAYSPDRSRFTTSGTIAIGSADQTATQDAVSHDYQVTISRATPERIVGSAFDPGDPEGPKLAVELFRVPFDPNLGPMDAASADMSDPQFIGSSLGSVGFSFYVAGKGLRVGDEVLVRAYSPDRSRFRTSGIATVQASTDAPAAPPSAAPAAPPSAAPTAASSPTAPAPWVSPATQSCREGPIWQRIVNRQYPSVFQAWTSAESINDNVTGQKSAISGNDEQWLAKHDLIWHSPTFFGLEWNNSHALLATDFTAASKSAFQAKLARLRGYNPNMTILAEIRFHDAWNEDLPEDSPWWAKDSGGKRIVAWQQGAKVLYSLDYGSQQLLQQIALQAKAATEAGFDGVFLDWWNWPQQNEKELLKAIRDNMDPCKLVIVNSGNQVLNEYPYPDIDQKPLINGLFMEGFGDPTWGQSWTDWRTVANNLTWAEANLRPPHIVAVEGVYTWDNPLKRADYKRMRWVTTLQLTHSDGFVLFGDANGLTVDHMHDLYPFWTDKSLGKLSGQKVSRDDGAFSRDYEKGTAVFNPPDNKAVTVQFAEERASAATGRRSTRFELDAGDGDLYIK